MDRTLHIIDIMKQLCNVPCTVKNKHGCYYVSIPGKVDDVQALIDKFADDFDIYFLAGGKAVSMHLCRNNNEHIAVDVPERMNECSKEVCQAVVYSHIKVEEDDKPGKALQLLAEKYLRSSMSFKSISTQVSSVLRITSGCITETDIADILQWGETNEEFSTKVSIVYSGTICITVTPKSGFRSKKRKKRMSPY